MIRLALLSLITICIGCSATVEAPADFPEPLMGTTPLVAGLYLTPAFTDFQYEEEVDGGRDWSVALGRGSVAWLAGLLRARYQQLIPVSSRKDLQDSGVQLLFVPSIESFQFSSPDGRHAEFYEAWIKYRIRVYTGRGQALADWPISAYGKQRGALVGGGEDAMALAARLAMRDATAALAVKLSNPEWAEKPR